MRIIVPQVVSDAMLLASNVPENDYPAWASGTTYAERARVIRGHQIFQSIQANNTGHDPATDTTQTYWVAMGATNRWRAFDSRLGSVTALAGKITFSIRLSRSLDSICFFGLSAQTVTVTAKAPGASAPFYASTTKLSERRNVINFWTYLFDEFELKPDLIITGVNLPSGSEISITIDAASGTAQVSEIVIGRNIKIGTTVEGTSLGIVDYSVKDRDEWGGVFIVPRPVTETVRFRFTVETETAAAVQQVIKQASNRICVFASEVGTDIYGTTVLGLMRDYDLSLAKPFSEGSIEVESLA